MNFEQALSWVKTLKASGEIRQFHVERHPAMGRVITASTDQGWNPDPYYAEFPAECFKQSQRATHPECSLFFFVHP